VSFTDENIGTVVGYHPGPSIEGEEFLDNVILRTTDGGENWISQTSGTSQYLRAVSFIDVYNGIIVCQSEYGFSESIILRTTDGGVSFVEENELGEIPTYYDLTQNYPNPFNPSTKIIYSVPKSSKVLIKVYDILGNEIETLVNEEKQTGTYEITWYADNLPSGVYFYQLKAGDFIETKKMVLLR